MIQRAAFKVSVVVIIAAITYTAATALTAWLAGTLA